MDKKTDLRIVKTKKGLFEALLTLMKQKNFDQIRVSDICEVALINRSTFYAHYEDKYDLLIELVENLQNTFLNELNVNTHEIISKEYFMELLRILINHIDDNREIYNIIDSSVPVDTIVKFYLGGIVNIGIDWIVNIDKYSKEDILMYLSKLIPDKI